MSAAAERGPVLVVEDDPDLSALLEIILTDAGYDVDVAGDGARALELVERRMPALILLDMRMPVMNGWEFARVFEQRHGPAAPIVVVTAAENARLRATEIGAAAWLEKPFEIDDVLATAARFVRPAEPAPLAP